jgi:hypothetical protein
MLSNKHFYHRITRKLVVSFGSLFNNLRLVRYNLDGTQEIERIVVPLTYASKEKFFVRITQDPTLFKEVSLTLPRMSFDLNAITYDPLRKTSSFVDSMPEDNGKIKRVKKVPYNFDFTLYAYVRNTEDGTQIVEQILPYFAPDYTVTVDLAGLDGLKLDVPIILNSIQYDDNDTGSPEETRVMTWTMTFTAKAYLFGLIGGEGEDNDGKIIRKVTANLYSSVETTDRLFTFISGSGTFKQGELVYQGNSINSATATAFVRNWMPLSNNLIVYDATGSFSPGKNITGVITGAKYNVATYTNEDYQVARITVTPNPPTANADDDFGFTTTIQEVTNLD